MSRKFFSSFMFVILLVVVLLVAGSSNARAEEKGSALRGSVRLVSQCVVPYNVDGYGFKTGIHIVTSSATTKHLNVSFFCGGTYYASNSITVYPKGWTGLINDLLPRGVSFRTPTLLYVNYYKDPNSEWSGKFWVTQFLFTEYGFSHQILASEALP